MRLFIVDAFTDRPFAGNPAAVALASETISDAQMQQIAAEMNLAETAFPLPRADGTHGLRWFTPRAEVDLCGHATLATAHALWTEGGVPRDAPLVFETKGGRLACTPLPDGRIEMDFPATPAAAAPAPEGFAEALGALPVWTGRSRYDLVARLESADAVRRLAPDLAALARLDVRGVTVTAEGDDGFDCVSRFFAPALGVPEDPVTGSAHCALAPYWAAETGRTTLRAFQASPRGGALELEVVGEHVRLRGHAVTVLRGDLRV